MVVTIAPWSKEVQVPIEVGKEDVIVRPHGEHSYVFPYCPSIVQRIAFYGWVTRTIGNGHLVVECDGFSLARKLLLHKC